MILATDKFEPSIVTERHIEILAKMLRKVQHGGITGWETLNITKESDNLFLIDQNIGNHFETCLNTAWESWKDQKEVMFQGIKGSYYTGIEGYSLFATNCIIVEFGQFSLVYWF